MDRMSLWSRGRSIAASLALRVAPDHVRYGHTILPARHLRYGGPEFADDSHFLRSTEREAERLVVRLGYTPESRLLDIGCGVGRLAIGILSRLGEARHYTGLDVSERSIRWCREHLGRGHPGLQFMRINVRNARYNPRGEPIGAEFRFPFADGAFDIIYLYSVFSHMLGEDVQLYLQEMHRLLAEAGRVFFTAFVEDGVPSISVNPAGYREDWQGELHCVRYSRDHLYRLIDSCGFGVDGLEYATETNGQSALYLVKRRKPPSP